MALLYLYVSIERACIYLNKFIYIRIYIYVYCLNDSIVFSYMRIFKTSVEIFFLIFNPCIEKKLLDKLNNDLNSLIVWKERVIFPIFVVLFMEVVR